MMDIYFDSNYGKLYEKTENGKSVCWKYDGKEGVVTHQFLYREIPIATKEKWFDIVTPYGYGGPIVEKVNDGYSTKDAVAAFEKEFALYCRDNKIVSEFVRFHPIMNNAEDFKSVYGSECIRHTLGTNLKNSEDPVASEFSKSCRKSIRQAINKGVSWRITPQPEDIKKFKEIYFSTMDRNDATDYYYFDDDYFNDCIKYFKQNLLFVEAIFEDKTIAAGIYFVYNKIIHIHLSGTLSEYLYLSPAYILRYATAMWGIENGYELIHHGGGKTNSPDDSLYKFKKQFAKNTEFDFCVGRKIWNDKMYKELCSISCNHAESDFFPAYRK